MSCIDLADLGIRVRLPGAGHGIDVAVVLQRHAVHLGGDFADPVAAVEAFATMPGIGEDGWRGNREAGDDEHDMIAGSALSNPLIVGIICGVFLFAASTLQQYGIMFGRSAGRAGFITALYIVMVPLLAYLVLRRAVRMMTWMAVGVAVAGFYLLCITDDFGSLTLADCLLLFTAVLFAAHILSIDTLGARVDALTLSFIQFLTTAALSWAGTLIEGSMDWNGAGQAWIAVLYAGIGSVGVAYTLQAVGQQWVPPTRASLIMSLESVFSVIGGALLLGETMTVRGYLGCALIFAGIVLAQMPGVGRRRLAVNKTGKRDQ